MFSHATRILGPGSFQHLGVLANGTLELRNEQPEASSYKGGKKPPSSKASLSGEKHARSLILEDVKAEAQDIGRRARLQRNRGGRKSGGGQIQKRLRATIDRCGLLRLPLGPWEPGRVSDGSHRSTADDLMLRNHRGWSGAGQRWSDPRSLILLSERPAMPVICVASLECLDVAWPPRSNLLSLDEVLYHPRGAVGTLFAGFCGQQNFHGSVEQSLDGLREYIHTPRTDDLAGLGEKSRRME
ncbi:hypothetical protein CIRG_05915 [Coccidioides immitis RMSCC 2394]|uniref:Uncharacterized protein n=1 Tax=Coccidioides immitis RMSCC 2394 TaxID=404692 RepID=A0A0J6YGN1_COCIT|nr:hypothetical protein CIRG_05915 [Coccidioides immitis RMSCC 2394]